MAWLAGSAAGSGAGTAAGAGAGAGAAGAGYGASLMSGLQSAAQGVGQAGQSLMMNPQAAYLQSLGQTVPQGVQLAGPSSTFESLGSQLASGAGGFGRGFLQGYTGTPGVGEMGGFSPQGVGSMLGGMAQGGGGGHGTDIAGIMRLLQGMGGQQGPATQVMQPGPQAQGKTLIQQLLAGI